ACFFSGTGRRRSPASCASGRRSTWRGAAPRSAAWPPRPATPTRPTSPAKCGPWPAFRCASWSASRVEVHVVAVRVDQYRVPLAPEGVPRLLVGGVAGPGQVGEDAVDLGRAGALEGEAEGVAAGRGRPARVERP